jgi:pimeloyl-ACP methyl ester carboxylesterase
MSESLVTFLDSQDASFDNALHEGLTTGAITTIAQLGLSYPGPFCEKSEDLSYLAHINTPNVARDLDLIRNLMGYQTLEYWGFGYGAILGTMYAALFPDRVGRMVLDGNAQERK